jgi:hypothetical protein
MRRIIKCKYKPPGKTATFFPTRKISMASWYRTCRFFPSAIEIEIGIEIGIGIEKYSR